jgi:hypothetical protein
MRQTKQYRRGDRDLGSRRSMYDNFIYEYGYLPCQLDMVLRDDYIQDFSLVGYVLTLWVGRHGFPPMDTHLTCGANMLAIH